MATHIQPAAAMNRIMNTMGIGQTQVEREDEAGLAALEAFQDDPNKMQRKMNAHVANTHPRVTKVVDQSCCCMKRQARLREEHSWCFTELGSHGFLGGKDSKSEFENYGVGIVLYFKYLKYFVVVYTVLCILAIPSMVIFSLGGKLEDVDSSFGAIAMTTLGNLGESRVTCQIANDDDVMQLACQEGAIIGRIQAYYGQPAGSCDCPSNRVPDPACAPRVGDACAEPGAACFFSTLRDVKLPNGEDFTAGSCCATELDADGIPSFADLDIRVTPGCDAASAERIVKGVCAGKQQCSMVVSPDLNYTWAPQSTYATFCHGQTSEQVVDGHVVECTEAFNSHGGLDSCAGGRFAVGRLIVIAQCFDTHLSINGELVDKQELVGIIGVAEFFSVLFLVLAWLYLRRKENKAASLNDFNTATASDYTVMIRFRHKYSDSQQLEEILRAHFKALLGKDEIAAINFGYNNGISIDTLRLRGKAMLELDRLNSLLAKSMRKKNIRVPELTRKSFKSHAKQVNQLGHYNRLLRRLDQLAKNLRMRHLAKERKIVVAFVTFNNEQNQIDALKLYPTDWVSRCRCCQKPAKRLEGRYFIKVDQAPEPSDVIWENLATPPLQRFVRRAVIGLVVAIALFVTLVLVFISQSVKQENLRQFPAVDCSTMTDISNQTLVVQDVLWEKYNQTSGNTGRLGCYCKDIALSAGFFSMFTKIGDVVNTEFPEPDLDGETRWCRTWMETFGTNSLLTYGAVIFVLVVNISMRTLLKRFVDYERHGSRTGEVVSLGSQLFITQLINTGLVYLLVNARIKTNVEWLAIGSYSDFTAAWFSTVGVSIMMTMGTNMVFPHAAPCCRTLFDCCKRRKDRACLGDKQVTRRKTQAAYNALYSGQSFRFAERYAAQLNTFVITLVYSTGLPMLLVLALIGTALSYWIDKLFFVKFSKTPIAYDDGMSKFATRMMPWAILAKLCVGIWMLSNTNIVADEALQAALLSSADAAGDAGNFAKDQLDTFDPGLNMSSRMFSNHVLPLTTILFILIALAVVWIVILKPCHLAWSCLSCCNETKKLEGLPPYFRGIPMEGLISSLQRGGVDQYNASEYVKSCEIHIFHHSKNQVLAEHGDYTVDQAEADAFKEVQNFRRNIERGFTVASAAKASTRGASDGTAELRNAGDVTQGADARMTFEELKNTPAPDPFRLMPPHQHSYDIQEVMEYHDAFALHAYVADSLKVGLDGLPMAHHKHVKMVGSMTSMVDAMVGHGHSRHRSTDSGRDRRSPRDVDVETGGNGSPLAMSGGPGSPLTAAGPPQARRVTALAVPRHHRATDSRGSPLFNQSPGTVVQRTPRTQQAAMAYNPNNMYFPPGCPPGQDPRTYFTQEQVTAYNQQLQMMYMQQQAQQHLRMR